METLAEDLLLISLDDDRGKVSWRHSAAVHYGLAAAFLMDLALLRRIETPGENIVVSDPTPLQDDLLDAVVARINSSEKERDAKHWVKTLGDESDCQQRLARRLVARGILREEEQTLFWAFHDQRYPTVMTEPESTLRERLQGVVLRGDEPEPRTLLLLSLVSACGLIDEIFAPAERRDAKRRIKVLVEDEQFGKSVGAALAVVAAATAAVAATTAFTTVIAPGSSH